MSYRVLARKFRPGTFDEVVGQEPIVRTLRNAVDGGRLAHAYLFSGPRGVGKTTLARILAKCLNCRKAEAPTVDPCGECESCREIAESESLDVQEIDGASNRGIDDIRELRETSRYQPTRDRSRVFIIDEVHMLTREAFNALLKTLEEPPAHVVFLFATTEYQKVPATIASRCQHFEFRRIERGTLTRRLIGVAEAEGISLGERGADLLARSASGSLRDALGFLDQAVAYCGKEITEEGLREILGVAGRESVDRFLASVAARDGAALLSQVDELARSGQDLGHFCREVLERVRELLLLSATPDGARILGMSDAEAGDARKLAEPCSQEDLVRLGGFLADLDGRLRFTPHPRFLVEMAAIRLARTASVRPLGEIIERLEALEGGTPLPADEPESGGAPPARTGGRSGGPAGGGPKRSGRRAESAPSPVEPVAAASKEDEIRQRVAGKRGALASYLEHASSLKLEADRLVIRFPARHALFLNGLSRADNRELVEQAVREATGKDLRIDLGISEEADPEMEGLAREESKAARKQVLMSRALEEPVVKSFMDRFGASVVRIEESDDR